MVSGAHAGIQPVIVMDTFFILGIGSGIICWKFVAKTLLLSSNTNWTCVCVVLCCVVLVLFFPRHFRRVLEPKKYFLFFFFSSISLLGKTSWHRDSTSGSFHLGDLFSKDMLHQPQFIWPRNDAVAKTPDNISFSWLQTGIWSWSCGFMVHFNYSRC